MTPTARKSGLSLGARLFLAFGLVLALAVGGAMIVTLQVVRDIASDTVETSLSNSQSVQRYFRQFRARQLELVTELVSSDPYFGSYVDEAVRADDPELAARSVADLLQSRRNEFGLDIALVLDPEGRVIARTDRPQALAVDLSDNPLVARGSEELVPVSGLWTSGDALYQATVTPIARGRTVAGLLVAGLAIDNALANDVKRVSGADVAYLAAGDRLRVLATTLDVPATDRLLAELDASGAAEPSLLESADTDRLHRLELGGDRWLMQLSPLVDARGAVFGTTVALTSLDRELAAYQNIPMFVLVTGVVAIALALLLSYLISQRILQPVRRLTSAAEAALDGNFRHEVATDGADEIGRLSRAFDSLLSSLREKRDMEDYMADMARHVPGGAAKEAPPSKRSESDEQATRAMTPGEVTDSPSGNLRRHLGSRYELLSELGRGAMGVVFKAHDQELDEIVAIKMLKPGSVDENGLERLKSELKLARRITHPNVLRTYDFGEAGDAPYLSMEYVSGMTLRELLDRRGRLPYGAALRIARQLCAGLEAVHEVGVLHRDIKPGNVMLEHRGNAKLMDFGISRPARGEETSTGELEGTPHYMAPEQIRGGQPDVRTDIYSLGVVFEELFTGGLPFSGESAMEIAAARLHKPPVPPSHYWPEVPEALEAIILRCLAADPDDRYPDAQSLARELGRLRG
ncbi:MAG: protein kinase [Gammaproteobacteria bacterium]|nr:protein kinase [Gammaproteobacteria bacterium]